MNDRETQALQAAADAYARRTDQLRISDEEMAGQLTMDAETQAAVTTTVRGIGGRSERVSGTVVGHRRNAVVLETECHGRIVVPLAELD